MRNRSPFLSCLVALVLLVMPVVAQGPDPLPPTSKRVVAYYTAWSIYARNFNVADIPAEKLTHINYAFANVSSGGEVILGDPWADVEKSYPGDVWDQPLKGNFNQLNKLKQQHPHLKTLISVGGWTWSGNFSDAAVSATSRQRFAASAVDFMIRYGFDGVDIDWEYPVGGGLPDNGTRPEDKQNFTLLMQELRTQLDAQGAQDGKYYLLTAAVGAGYDKIANLEVAQIGQLLDFINLMGYDFHGGWETTTNHHALLFPNPNDPSPNTDIRDKYNSSYAINAYLEGGIPADKLVLGVPFYGRAWQGVTNANNGLYQTGTGPAPGTWDDWASGDTGVNDYWEIREFEASPEYTRYWDDHAKVPYLYSPTRYGGHFIGYEDPESLGIKVDYMNSKQMGGIMFWDISNDDRTFGPDSLLDTIFRRLQDDNRPPVADAGPDAEYNAPATIMLDGSRSYDPENAALTYAWQQVSGPTVDLTGASAAIAEFSVAAASATEVYTFRLTVNDGSLTGSDTVSITVVGDSNSAPIANAGPDAAYQAPVRVVLDGSESRDPDGDMLTYMWQQESGMPVTLLNADSSMAEFTVDGVVAPETLTFSLSVSDGSLSDRDDVIITITSEPVNNAPVAIAGDDQTVASNSSVSLDAGNSVDPDGDALTFSWQVPNGIVVDNPNAAVINFTAPQVSVDTTYEFTVTVSDQEPLSDMDSVIVTVLADSGCNTGPNPADYPAWDANTVYLGGDRVSFSDVVWEAKWWTRGEQPGTSNVWDNLSGSEEWDPSRAYNGGDEVNYGERRYRARWWTQGDNPATSDVWTDIGPSTGC